MELALSGPRKLPYYITESEGERRWELIAKVWGNWSISEEEAPG